MANSRQQGHIPIEIMQHSSSLPKEDGDLVMMFVILLQSHGSVLWSGPQSGSYIAMTET